MVENFRPINARLGNGAVNNLEGDCLQTFFISSSNWMKSTDRAFPSEKGKG